VPPGVATVVPWLMAVCAPVIPSRGYHAR
jgi:hypothetical protein